MNMHDVTLARKYAQAFVNVNKEHLTDTVIEKTKKLEYYLAKYKHVLLYVQLSFLDKEKIRKNFFELLTQFHMDSLFKRLIILLEQENRLFLLPRILEHIVLIYNDLHNIMEFTIVSSHRLDEPEIEEIVKVLSKNTGKHILYTIKIDKNLIAGIKIYSDTYGWEHSVKKQLRALKMAI